MTVCELFLSSLSDGVCEFDLEPFAMYVAEKMSDGRTGGDVLYSWQTDCKQYGQTLFVDKDRWDSIERVLQLCAPHLTIKITRVSWVIQTEVLQIRFTTTLDDIDIGGILKL